MSDMVWATTSCSSRAIRVFSSAITRCSCSSAETARSRVSWLRTLRHSRTTMPTTSAAPTVDAATMMLTAESSASRGIEIHTPIVPSTLPTQATKPTRARACTPTRSTTIACVTIVVTAHGHGACWPPIAASESSGTTRAATIAAATGRSRAAGMATACTRASPKAMATGIP